MVAWVPEAASAGESARRAPASIRGSTLLGLLFHTASSWPASSKFLAIGAPIAPSPMNPSCIGFPASFGNGWCSLQLLLLHERFSLLKALWRMVNDIMGDHGQPLAEVESPYCIFGARSASVSRECWRMYSDQDSVRALRPEVPSSLRKYRTNSEKRTTYPFVRDRVILPAAAVGEEHSRRPLHEALSGRERRALTGYATGA